jgi:hypothetical protein
MTITAERLNRRYNKIQNPSLKYLSILAATASQKTFVKIAIKITGSELLSGDF